MHEGEFEKTRMLRAPTAEPEPTPAPATDVPDPNATIIIRPSARAVSAAAELARARRQRLAEQHAGEFNYSGQVDFDVTANDIPVVAPRPHWWQRWRLLAAIILGLIVGVAALWWGWLDAARIVPVR